MKRLLRLAARLYPAAWRDRYGVEFQALLDETKPSWRDVVDVLNGGLQMRLRRAHPALTVAVFGIAGAVGAGAIAFSTTNRFESTGTMIVRPGDPSTASKTARLENVMPRLARDAFSRDTLMYIIEKDHLYRSERAQSSTEDVVNRMRGDIGIQLISRSIVQVSFTSADFRQTQQVADDLMRQIVRSNLYEGSGSVVQLIDPPDEPQVSVSPRRVAVASLCGLGGGALIGTLIRLLRRRVSQPAS
jgi:uncharacterized protein involved in exopolysaccharide biosynthesis